MNQAQAYDDDDDDEDELPEREPPAEARVVNISNERFVIRIGTSAGTPPRKYKFAPYGKEGSSHMLQAGYTLPYKGAGRGMVQPTIERMSEREIVTYIAPTPLDNGRKAIRVPLIVHEDKAAQARAAYLNALRLAGVDSDPTLEAAGKLEQHATKIRREKARVAAAAVKAKPFEDVESQDSGQLDEPPPDDDMPLPSEAPALARAEPVVVDSKPEPVTIPRRGGGKG